MLSVTKKGAKSVGSIEPGRSDQSLNMKRITLADVAKHSGVSKMTVSRVVSGVQCVKTATKKRIEASLAELGYKADPMLRSLAAYRSRATADTTSRYRSTLAYLDFDCDEYSLEMFEKASSAASVLGYDFKHFKFPAKKDEQHKLSRRLWMQGIRGLLFGPAQHERHLGAFQMDQFSMVSIGAFHHSPSIDTVGADYFQTLQLAASQCYNEGARRIALYIPEDREAYTGHRWIGAYQAFCQNYKLEPLQCPAFVGSTHGKKIVAWMKRQKADAIIGLQGIRLFQAMLPHVTFACLNDWQAVLDGGYAHVPREEIAKEAIGVLDYNLLRRRYGIPSWPRHISIEGKWRNSLKDMPFAEGVQSQD